MKEVEVEVAMMCSSLKKEIKKVANRIISQSDTYESALRQVKDVSFRNTDPLADFLIEEISEEIRKVALKKDCK